MFFRHQQKNSHTSQSFSKKTSRGKKLRIESLEDRRVLATLVVTDLGDDTLGSLAGDGLLSLREAVEAINTGAPVDGIGPSAGSFGVADTILFSNSLFGGAPQTLALTAGQLELSSSVTLSGPVGNLLTIDAQQNSRLFDIPTGEDDFVFDQVTLTGGLTTGFGDQGGAIRSLGQGNIRIQNSSLVGNKTVANFSHGGGISTTGSIELVDSRVSNNTTEGTGSTGGGVFATGDLTVTRSTIAGNRTLGVFSSGAGLSSNGFVTLESSTVSSNSAEGPSSGAAGILGREGVLLTESTVSGNETAGTSGGGISSEEGSITVTRSTVVNNRALGANATGGGLRTTSTDIIVSGSIIANNTAGGGNVDIQPGTGVLTVEFSLIGDATGLGISAVLNILDQDPLLGPLAESGPTETHAPLPGSPAIDGGAEFLILPPAFDQRGVGFARIADGDGNTSAVIDIGSHEVQSPATGDFDDDGDVDGSDFLAWQRGFGKTEAAVTADGNSDEDNDVDAQDLAVWSTLYAQPIVVALAAAQPNTSASAVTRKNAGVANLADAAFALDQSNVGTDKPEVLVQLQVANPGVQAALDSAFAVLRAEVPQFAEAESATAPAEIGKAARESIDLELAETLFSL